MRMNSLSVLVRLGLLAVTILLVAIMTVCLLSIRAASKLLDMVGLSNLCTEKGQFITNCCYIVICDLCYTLVATMYLYKFKMLVVV